MCASELAGCVVVCKPKYVCVGRYVQLCMHVGSHPIKLTDWFQFEKLPFIFLFKIISMKTNTNEKNPLYIKCIFKMPTSSQEMMEMKQCWPCTTYSTMTKHFHNVITFHIKLSELQHIFSKGCAVVVAWVNSRAFKELQVFGSHGCFSISCSSALIKKHNFFFKGNVVVEAYLNRLQCVNEMMFLEGRSEWRE